MKKVLVVFGYGPGVSRAVAERFGAEGFAVALVSRNRERLEAGVAALKAKGTEAGAFVADVTQPAQIRRAMDEIRARLGPATVLEWTAYGSDGGDLLSASPAELGSIFALPVTGLVSAVQAALPDLKQSQNAAVLLANGGLGLFDAANDRMAVEWNVMGLALANAAKHKLAALLALKLKPENIFVGEVMIMNVVKGSAFDQGNGTIESSAVANEFWKLYTTRSAPTAQIG